MKRQITLIIPLIFFTTLFISCTPNQTPSSLSSFQPQGDSQKEITIQNIVWSEDQIALTFSPNKFTIPSTRYLIELKSKDGKTSYGTQSCSWANIQEGTLNNPRSYITRQFFGCMNTEDSKPIAERKTDQELFNELITMIITKE